MPVVVSLLDPTYLDNRAATVGWTAAGQTVIGIAMSSALPTISSLSSLWLPSRLRTISTSITSSSFMIGNMLGFLVGQYTGPNSWRAQAVLYVEVSIILLLGIVWMLLPKLPVVPPSFSASQKRAQVSDRIESCDDVRLVVQQYCHALRQAFWRPAVSMLIFGGFVAQYLYVFFLSVIQYSSYGNGASGPVIPVSVSTWLGLGLILVALVSGRIILIMAGCCFPRRLKTVLVVSIAGVLLFAILLLPVTPLPGSDTPWVSSDYLFCAAFLGSAICYGPVIGVIFELLAETAYPLDEGITGGFMMMMGNAGGALNQIVLTLLPHNLQILTLCVLLVAALVCSIVMRVQYLRSDTDADELASGHVVREDVHSDVSRKSIASLVARDIRRSFRVSRSKSLRPKTNRSGSDVKKSHSLSCTYPSVDSQSIAISVTESTRLVPFRPTR